MIASTSQRAKIFGIEIDRYTLTEAVSLLHQWMQEGERRCRYVVTPNLDHAVQFQTNEALREAYDGASLVLADGWPLVTASRLFKDPLPERVAGSDVVPEVFRVAQTKGQPCTVFLLGAASGVAEIAAKNIQQRWPTVKVVGTYSPPLGFESDQVELSQIRELVNNCNPDVLVVGFGAPKQELFLKQHADQLSAGVAIAAGATIDFFAGRQRRAPVWVQRMRMEWSHRLLTNPRRLTGRYAKNAMALPQLLLREHRHRTAEC
ncbi:MAG: WecB/TagA/CpsF family glycosyltransferase [Fuerstiella sp.]